MCALSDFARSSDTARLAFAKRFLHAGSFFSAFHSQQPNRRMKQLLLPILALLLSQAPSFAQSKLVLLVDQDAKTLEWAEGYNITRLAGPFDDNTFGQVLITPQAQVISPLLNYSGGGSHTGVSFEFAQNRSTIVSIRLGTTAPPGEGATFSGTSDGPAIPNFTSGDWSRFASLSRGEYVLNSTFDVWGGGIQVMVVPEPAPWAFLALGLVSIVALRNRRQCVGK